MQRQIRYVAIRGPQSRSDMCARWELHCNQLVVAEEKGMSNSRRRKAGLRRQQFDIFRPQKYVNRTTNGLARSQNAQFTLDGIPVANTWQEIRVTDELGHSSVGRAGVQFTGRCHLLHTAIQHDRHPVDQTERLLLIMRDENGSRVGST